MVHPANCPTPLCIHLPRYYNAFASLSFVSAAILNGVLVWSYRDANDAAVGPVLWCAWVAVTLVFLLLTVTLLKCGGRSEVRTCIQHRCPGISKYYCFPMDVENPEQATWGEVEQKWLVAREKAQIGELGIASIVNDAHGGGARGVENFHRSVTEKFSMLYHLQLLRGFDQGRVQADPATASKAASGAASSVFGSAVLGETAAQGSEFCGNCYVSASAPFEAPLARYVMFPSRSARSAHVDAYLPPTAHALCAHPLHRHLPRACPCRHPTTTTSSWTSTSRSGRSVRGTRMCAISLTAASCASSSTAVLR